MQCSCWCDGAGNAGEVPAGLNSDSRLVPSTPICREPRVLAARGSLKNATDRTVVSLQNRAAVSWRMPACRSDLPPVLPFPRMLRYSLVSRATSCSVGLRRLS